MPDDAPVTSAVSGLDDGTVGMGRRRRSGLRRFCARTAASAYDEDDPAQGSEPARRYEGMDARLRATMYLSPTEGGVQMKALSGVDGAFLHLETKETPMHVASLHLFDLPPGHAGDFHADIKRQMRRRLRLAPPLTRKLAPMPLQFANPVWVDEDRLDMDYHVQRVTLPSPGTQNCSTAAVRCGAWP
jgi:hypothetical protein